jgi:malonyl-CoA decarboxylase
MGRLRAIVAARRGRFRAPVRPPARRRERQVLTDGELDALLRPLRACAEGAGGTASALADAAELKAAYERLSRAARRHFLTEAAKELGLDRDRVADLARAMLDATEEDRLSAEAALRQALETPWLRVLRYLNRLTGGTRFLVDLRRDLLRFERNDPELLALEQELRGLLQTWFDAGFLELRRVTWNSSASLLERLARSEAVHTVAGWDDLKNRLDSDRRFFACFHLRMPDDPLAFVEVALTRGIPREIGPLLDQHAPTVDPNGADTAIFYSISNVERGLRGIPFGGFVIQNVVEALSHELPRLRTFATISPIPGFRKWLDRGEADTVLRRDERRELQVAFAAFSVDSLPQLLTRDWTADEGAVSTLRRPLLRLCATYLLGETGAAADGVLRFHLSNGAYLEQISWLADRSTRGMAQSAGLMAHYVYERPRIAENEEAFRRRREIVASDAIKRLRRD